MCVWSSAGSDLAGLVGGRSHCRDQGAELCARRDSHRAPPFMKFLERPYRPPVRSHRRLRRRFVRAPKEPALGFERPSRFGASRARLWTPRPARSVSPADRRAPKFCTLVGRRRMRRRRLRETRQLKRQFLNSLRINLSSPSVRPSPLAGRRREPHGPQRGPIGEAPLAAGPAALGRCAVSARAGASGAATPPPAVPELPIRPARAGDSSSRSGAVISRVRAPGRCLNIVYIFTPIWSIRFRVAQRFDDVNKARASRTWAKVGGRRSSAATLEPAPGGAGSNRHHQAVIWFGETHRRASPAARREPAARRSRCSTPPPRPAPRRARPAAQRRAARLRSRRGGPRPWR